MYQGSHMPTNTGISRRKFIQSSLTTLAVCTLPAGNALSAEQRHEMQLLLLGTQGGPNFNLSRGETASLVIVGDRPYLVDCGYGTMRALNQAGIPFLNIAQVFLTHLHDDHTADLATLLGHQWTQGRVEQTQVYGPYGTDDLVRGALLFNKANTEIRLQDEARSVHPDDLFSGNVINATAKPERVFADDRVRVLSIENTHYPAAAREHMPHRALAYRFENEQRSIVFSGDTGYSANLVSLARDADVLVCETIHVDSTRKWFEQVVADGLYKDNAEGIWDHIIGTHTSTEDAGRMAAEAGVETLVLNHLLPGALAELPLEKYIEGARRKFQGKVIVGTDQQWL